MLKDIGSHDLYSQLPRREIIWQDRIYSVITTCDQSLTLAVRGRNEPEFNPMKQERMHHPKGAWSETLWIYGKAFELMMEQELPLHVCVVGLGLGYIELLVAASAVKAARMAELKILSFESDPFLANGFLSWLDSRSGDYGQLHAVLDEVNRVVARHFDLSPLVLRESLCFMRDEGRFQLRGEILAEHPRQAHFFPFACAGIFYDAFSSKINPHLWEEQFLFDFIQAAAMPKAVFATYAARGVLNRALKKLQFLRQTTEGFGGKRETTLGLRLQ